MRASEHLPIHFNAAEWFVGRHVREGNAANLAIVTDDVTMRYAQLDDRVRRFAALLRASGLRRGDRVALVLPDTPLLAIAFWGTIAAGGIAVPLNTLLKSADYRTIFEDCDPRVILADPSIVDARSVFEDAAIWNPVETTIAIDETPPQAGYAKTHRDAFAFLLYSSGTTGEPKGVVHLQHDMWISCETYGRAILGIGPEDRCLSVAKIFFAYGLGNSLYFPNHVGASSILLSARPTARAMFEAVKKHQPTLFFGVPTAYANMLAEMDAGVPYDFSSVRSCASAGEALPAAIYERWLERTGIEILDGIGSTEIGHIFLSNRRGACRPGSTGIPVPGFQLRLVDENGNESREGELGDLLVNGDSTAAFYWNKHDISKQTFLGEWIRTGDKYMRDRQGFFFHAGRSDDMIKAGGIWVSPVEVEGVIMSHPWILECAVVGAPDADGLHKPHAYVTLKVDVGNEAIEEEIRAYVKQKLAPYKTPRWVTVVQELPKTATGKIQRFQLRAP